jgi:hypothetical protein
LGFGVHLLSVRKTFHSPRSSSPPSILGLVTVSILCLFAGALFAVAHEGLPRLLFAGAGFSGYLFFFAHAMRELALPGVLVEGRPAPDGEVVRTEPDRDHVLPAAA